MLSNRDIQSLIKVSMHRSLKKLSFALIIEMNTYRFTVHVFVLLVLATFSTERGLARQQTKHQGYSLSERVVSPKEYLGFPEVWAISSDSYNNLYVGSQDGISFFDGKNWSTIDTELQTTIRSMAFGFDGKMYVGEQGDIGFVSPDSLGSMKYQSLLKSHGQGIEKFADVWATHVTSTAVIFQTSDRIITWDGLELEEIKSTAGFHTSFLIEDKIIVREKGVGLVALHDGSLSLIEGAGFFSDMRVFFIHKIGAEKLLVGTRDNGFFVLDDGLVSRFQTEVDEILREVWLYGGLEIQPGVIALNTLGSGVLLITENGKFLGRLNESAQDVDLHVTTLHLSNQNQIWLGKRNSGIVGLSNPLSISKYSHRSGLSGFINDIEISSTGMSISTGSGLFRSTKKKADFEPHVFAEIENVTNSFGTYTGEHFSLIMSDDGVHGEYNGLVKNIGGLEKLSFVVVPGNRSLNEFWIGTNEGLELAQVRVVSDTLQTSNIASHKFGTATRKIFYMEKFEEIWLVQKRDLIFRVSEQAFKTSKADPTPYEIGSNPQLSSIVSEQINGEVAYSSGSAIFKYDRPNDSFMPFIEFENSGGDGTMEIQAFTQAPNGDVWIAFADSISRISSSGMSSTLWTPESLKYSRGETSVIVVDSANVVWFNNGNELVQFDPSFEVVNEGEFNAHVSHVTKNSDRTVLFHGTYRAKTGGVDFHQAVWAVPELSFEEASLSFGLRSDELIEPENVEFRFRFEGEEDSSWSDWSEVSEVFKSGLKEGNYSFEM